MNWAKVRNYLGKIEYREIVKFYNESSIKYKAEGFNKKDCRNLAFKDLEELLK